MPANHTPSLDLGAGGMYNSPCFTHAKSAAGLAMSKRGQDACLALPVRFESGGEPILVNTKPKKLGITKGFAQKDRRNIELGGESTTFQSTLERHGDDDRIGCVAEVSQDHNFKKYSPYTVAVARIAGKKYKHDFPRLIQGVSTMLFQGPRVGNMRHQTLWCAVGDAMSLSGESPTP